MQLSRHDRRKYLSAHRMQVHTQVGSTESTRMHHAQTVNRVNSRPAELKARRSSQRGNEPDVIEIRTTPVASKRRTQEVNWARSRPSVRMMR